MGSNASGHKLDNLVGKRVRATTDFAGIPAGTVGEVVERYQFGQHEGIVVKWTTSSGHEVRDGFGRDAKLDETQWLELVEEGGTR